MTRDLLRQRNFLGHPTFSPDGETIAYFAGSELFLIDADGNRPSRRVKDAHGTSNSMPSWSRDGRHLFFYQTAPRSSFRKISIEGGRSVEVASDWRWFTHYSAKVDPTGKFVSYTRLKDDEARIHNLQTGKDWKLDVPLTNMTWANDGGALVGSRHYVPKNNPIRIYPLDGRPFRLLTEGYAPLWSTDGSLIYFLRESPAEAELWSIPTDGSDGDESLVTKLGPMDDIATFYDVSSKGEVVWAAAEEGNRELWLVDLESE